MRRSLLTIAAACMWFAGTNVMAMGAPVRRISANGLTYIITKRKSALSAFPNTAAVGQFRSTRTM
mgnify:CR=1 FL=1